MVESDGSGWDLSNETIKIWNFLFSRKLCWNKSGTAANCGATE